MSITLPKPFETLEPFAEKWALPTQNQRQRQRIGSSRGELKAFYDAILPLISDIITYADRFPLGQLPPEAQPVFNMALSLAEIAPHIELYGGTAKVPHSFDENRFIAEHGEAVG